MACNTRGGSAGRELGGWQQEGEEEEIGGEEEGEAKSKAGGIGVLCTFSMSSLVLQTQLSVSLYYTLHVREVQGPPSQTATPSITPCQWMWGIKH